MCSYTNSLRNLKYCCSCLCQKVFTCVPACICEFVILLSVPAPGLQRLKYFCIVHRLHRFVLLEYTLARAIIFQLNENWIFLSFRDQTYLLSSVTFLLSISLKEAGWLWNLVSCFCVPTCVRQQQLQPPTEIWKTSTDQLRSEKKCRRRNITWYNPPFSKRLFSNVGKKFLNIVKESFPNSNPLRKIFNKNTLKVSYSCMLSLDADNKSLLRKVLPMPEKLCNCRVKPNCPLDEKCLMENIIYQATVESEEGSKETYIGLTGNTFKTRFHKEI